MAAFCTNCGTASGGAKFCTNCGSSLDEAHLPKSSEAHLTKESDASLTKRSSGLGSSTISDSGNDDDREDDDYLDDDGEQMDGAINSGEWIVGSEIAPGLYRFSGYLARKDRHGGIISNGNANSGLGLTRVFPTDDVVEIRGQAIRADQYGAYDVLAEQPRDGCYLVGVDIEPGRYRLTAAGASAYYELLGREMERLTNGLNQGSLLVTIPSSAFAIRFTGLISRL